MSEETYELRPAGLHVGVIMDGNSRWARERKLLITQGHDAGAKAFRAIVEACPQLGISQLSAYVLSTENLLKRPFKEVRHILKLFEKYLREELPQLYKNNIRVRVVGERNDAQLGESLLRMIDEVEAATANCNGAQLNLLFNYGGVADCLHAALALAKRLQAGELAPDAVTENDILLCLTSKDVSPVDLLIRSGGEVRLSNFLPLQASYAELSFINELWPDVTPAIIAREIEVFMNRTRRYGGRPFVQAAE